MMMVEKRPQQPGHFGQIVQNSAPAQFTLTSPEEGDETGLTPTFTWVKSSDDDLNDELSYTLSLRI